MGHWLCARSIRVYKHTLSTTPSIISLESSRGGVFKWVLQILKRTFHLSRGVFSKESWSPGRFGWLERISRLSTWPSWRSVNRFVTGLLEVDNQAASIWSILKDSHSSFWNLGCSSHLKTKIRFLKIFLDFVAYFACEANISDTQTLWKSHSLDLDISSLTWEQCSRWAGPSSPGFHPGYR